MDMIKEGRQIAQEARARDVDTMARPGEYLTFRLGGEEYGLDILRVQEIRSYEAPTRIAGAPPHVMGVMNLRGAIVPIVDLRLRLGCTSVAYDDFTVVIVLNVEGRVVGAVVDSVSDVMELSAESIRVPPAMATDGVEKPYLTGIGCVGERMLILTDVSALVGGAKMGLLDV